MRSIKTFVILLCLSLAGCVALGVMLWRQQRAHLGEVERLALQHQVALQQQQEELGERLAEQTLRHEEMVKSLNDDFESRLDAVRGQQREKLAAAYEEFESIFEGNKQTIEYIDLLEGKVLAGQQISRSEVEKLAVIATGLGHLQKQYQKPLGEFQELAAYFERQAAKQPAAADQPKPRGSFFKRLFSKDYREQVKEQEKEFYRGQGEQRAFEAAQGEFSRVYASAQQSMRSVNLDADRQVQKLYQLMEEKDTANAADLSDFFEKARKALRTHQEVLQFEPDPALPPTPAP